MQEDKSRVHAIYQKYESFINMYDNLLNANNSLLLTKYINTRNENIANKLSQTMQTLGSVVFVSLSNEQVKEIAYYYENRFFTYLNFLTFKYARDLNMREIDQLKSNCLQTLCQARELLVSKKEDHIVEQEVLEVRG